MARDPGRRNFIVEFFRGVGYAFSGVWLIITRPELWPYVVVPIVVTFTLFAGGVGAFLYLTNGWAPEAGTAPADGAQLAPLAEFVRNLLSYGLKALFLVVFGAIVYFAASIIATPFNDAVSGQVEELRLGPYSAERTSWSQFFADTLRSFAHSGYGFVIWLATVGVAAALNLIPGFGTIASAILGVWVTAWFIARESMDGAQSRRRLSFAHKLRIARQHGWMFLGFGLVGASVVWIPVVNVFVVPFAIAGGTLMYCELEQAGRIPDASGAFGYTPPQARDARKADHRWRKKRA